MKLKIMVALVVLVPMLVTNIAFAEPPAPGHSENSDGLSEIDTPNYLDGHLMMAPEIDIKTDLAIHSENWFPEKPNKFKPFKRRPWGTKVQALAPGEYYVDIAIPLLTYIEGKAQYIETLEFCAESSNGAKTKPVKWEIWTYDRTTPLWNGEIGWPADNDKHCIGKTFGTGIWLQDLSIAVKLNFKSTSHNIFMHKAWVRTYETP